MGVKEVDKVAKREKTAGDVLFNAFSQNGQSLQDLIMAPFTSHQSNSPPIKHAHIVWCINDKGIEVARYDKIHLSI
jgi:hypothetical protein